MLQGTVPTYLQRRRVDKVDKFINCISFFDDLLQVYVKIKLFLCHLSLSETVLLKIPQLH